MPQGGPPDPATVLVAGPRWSGADIEARIRPLLDCRIREEIEPFLRAMQRRLARDCDRVHAYHDGLYRAAAKRLAALSGAEGERAEADRRRETMRLEAIEREHRAKLDDLRPGLRVVNCFGQSESIASTFHDLPDPLPDDDRPLCIGWPHPGADLLLIDDDGREVDRPDAVGEIHLCGAALFAGYYGDAAATARALVPHPLRPDSGERVFRTGDYAFRGEDGAFYFVGRRDLQVKVLGNRVELEEVERRLVAHADVAQACAAVVPGPGGQGALVAFVVPRRPELGDRALRSFCREALPPYMVPSSITLVPSLPTTTNGKVDRAALVALLTPPSLETP
jgi:acyl-coenzyme A synthetase/AMP-(fatty) acid ligase